jgi:hypothetical protein
MTSKTHYFIFKNKIQDFHVVYIMESLIDIIEPKWSVSFGRTSHIALTRFRYKQIISFYQSIVDLDLLENNSLVHSFLFYQPMNDNLLNSFIYVKMYSFLSKIFIFYVLMAHN